MSLVPDGVEVLEMPARAIPASDVAVRAERPSDRVADIGVATARNATIRILVVDDLRRQRDGCASLLQGDGYTVSSCGRSDEAIELLRRCRFDIILADLCAPPTSGFDVLKAALTTHPETIVVMMSSNPSVASSVEALRMGAWDYLPKPFSATHMRVLFGRAAHAVLARREDDGARDAGLARVARGATVALLGVSRPHFATRWTQRQESHPPMRR